MISKPYDVVLVRDGATGTAAQYGHIAVPAVLGRFLRGPET